MPAAYPSVNALPSAASPGFKRTADSAAVQRERPVARVARTSPSSSAPVVRGPYRRLKRSPSCRLEYVLPVILKERQHVLVRLRRQPKVLMYVQV